MKLLAIETAFEACSVALWLDGDCRERQALAPRGHAEVLLPWVEELLAEAALPLGALDAIAFSRGPGSFTSLRIGISVVQGLAFGASLPVAPVSSLAATAQAAAAPRMRVAMDARMQQLFCGDFEFRDGLAVALGPEALLAPGALAAPVAGGWTAVGNGFARFPQLAAQAGRYDAVVADCWPTARAVALLAGRWLAANPGLPPEGAQPVYLRDDVAEKTADRAAGKA